MMMKKTSMKNMAKKPTKKVTKKVTKSVPKKIVKKSTGMPKVMNAATKKLKAMFAKIKAQRKSVERKIRKATAAVALAEKSNAKLNRMESRAKKYIKKNQKKF